MQIQADLITKNNAPILELFYDSGYPDKVGMDMWQLLPFSRGNVTISSSDPFKKPKVNVNFFSAPWDLTVQIAGARLTRKIFNTAPLSSLRVAETYPGYATVPNDANGGTDANWKKWIAAQGTSAGFAAVAHPVGTCAMMRRSLVSNLPSSCYLSESEIDLSGWCC